MHHRASVVPVVPVVLFLLAGFAVARFPANTAYVSAHGTLTEPCGALGIGASRTPTHLVRFPCQGVIGAMAMNSTSDGAVTAPAVPASDRRWGATVLRELSCREAPVRIRVDEMRFLQIRRPAGRSAGACAY